MGVPDPRTVPPGHRRRRHTARFTILTCAAALTAVVASVSWVPNFIAPGVPVQLPTGCAKLSHCVEEDAISAAAARRSVVVGTGLGLLGRASPSQAEGGEPKITARCEFLIKIGAERRGASRKLVIGLYGEEAPILTRNFIQAATATYTGEAGKGVNYMLADVLSIEKDKCVTWANFKDGNQLRRQAIATNSQWVGYKEQKVPLADDSTKTDEVNNLKHDVAGRVSMKKGGGTFNFNVAQVANAVWLDKTDVVIGQVLEGMDLIKDINQISMYGSKPLTKVRIYSSKLLPNA